MPVDLSQDVVRVEERAAQLPILRYVCSLGIEIIKSAQGARRNREKIQNLAHFVSENLISIAKWCLENRDFSPERLKEHLDLLEIILRDVIKAINNYSTLFITTGNRDVDIKRLELQIIYATQSIFSMTAGSSGGTPPALVGFYNGSSLTDSQSPSSYQLGLATDRPKTAANFHRDAGLEINRPRTAVNSLYHVGNGRVSSLNREKGRLFVRGVAREKGPEVSSSRDSPELKVDIPINLVGRIIEFDNRRAGSPEPDELLPSWSRFLKLKSTPAHDLTGRIKIVKGPLSGGGFCDIYSGKLTTEKGVEFVAMKMLRSFNAEKHVRKAKKKFRREVNIWRSIKHPYILPFYGTFEYDDFRLFMVSPWAEGGHALEYLRNHPCTDRVRLLWQVASALEYLHSGKDVPPIVHGDLKADNVLMSSAGNALLSDFGLSRFEEELTSMSCGSSTSRTGPGGHARFMAPELLVTPKDSSHTCRSTFESDVFALASLMLQIYTEKVPFSELREAQAILKLASGELPARPVDSVILERGFNDHLWALMTDCWQFHPRERPNMKEVRWRLVWADEKTRAEG